MSSISSPSHYEQIPSNDYPQSYNDQNNEEQLSSTCDSPIQKTSLIPRTVINSPKTDHDSSAMGRQNVDFYDSEEEEDLGRYSVAFNQILVGNDDGGQSHSHNKDKQAKSDAPSRYDSDREAGNKRFIRSSPVRRLFHKIQDARMETRRKRWERLLALPDEATMHFHKERCALFFGTWCNLLDKGFIPIIFMLGIYVIILSKLSDEHAFVKNIMLGVGIPLFIFRISWRPLCWLVCEQRQAKRVSAKFLFFASSVIKYDFSRGAHSVFLFFRISSS